LSAQARKSLVVVVVLIAAALALTLPAALSSPRLNDSFWIDWVWLDQFARELASGHPYPRWLAQSHGGLGAPDFYYYPPVAFYIGALFVFAGLSTYAALTGEAGEGPIVCVVSGGNIDLGRFCELVADQV
jgi:uncharacterized membrane protein